MPVILLGHIPTVAAVGVATLPGTMGSRAPVGNSDDDSFDEVKEEMGEEEGEEEEEEEEARAEAAEEEAVEGEEDAPTSGPQGARHAQRVDNSSLGKCREDRCALPTDSRAPAPISTPPGAHRQRRTHTSSRSTGTRSPWPKLAARRIQERPQV